MPISKAEFERGEERYSIENEIIHFFQEESEQAYNVREVTDEVVQPGWSEASVDDPEYSDGVGRVLDLATVSSTLDKLVDNGAVERRIVDDGQGARSYYHCP